MKRWKYVVAIVALVPLALAACSSKEASNEAGGASQVATTLDDYAIRLAETTLSAGDVTFKIENVGATEHEMVVIRSDVAIEDIPVEGDEANEEGPGMTPIGEVEGVQPGETTELVLTLDPGRYILLCNLAKHFGRGMVTEIQVK